MLSFLKNIIQLILSPVHAWRDIARADLNPEILTSRGLYPLMAVMAVSVFVRPIYGVESFDLVVLLQTALIQFVAIFIALFIGKAGMSNLLPRSNGSGVSDPRAVETVAVYITGMVTLIQIFENLLPVELTIMEFLPLLVIIPLWKSSEYLEIESRSETRFMITSAVALLVPVIGLNLLMSYLIG